LFGIGGWELLVIAVAALVILGPKGLPAAARAIGKVLSELRRATDDLRQSIELDPELRDIPKALDEFNRPLMSSRSYPRTPPTPKDGPPDDLPRQRQDDEAASPQASADESSATVRRSGGSES
jgi:sec-independent protein translocase protein TatB